MGKLLVFVSVVLMFISAGLGFLNRNKVKDLVDKTANAETVATQSKNQVAKAQADLKAAQQELATATAEKEQAVSQLSGVQADLEKSRGQVTQITTEKTAVEAQITQLTTDLQTAKQELETARGATPAAPTEAAPDQQAAVAEKEALIAKLQSDLDAARSHVTTLTKEKQDRAQLKMRNNLQGRILAVNPAWNFVVLSLGDRNGVVNNSELLVKRGNQLIGKVRVTSVDPSTSIADIVSSSVPQGVSIAPGDNVIYQAVQE